MCMKISGNGFFTLTIDDELNGRSNNITSH